MLVDSPTSRDPLPPIDVHSTTSAPGFGRAPGAPTGGPDPRYRSCAEVIAAGLGPYTPADPEYAWYDDADADGVVCERG